MRHLVKDQMLGDQKWPRAQEFDTSSLATAALSNTQMAELVVAEDFHWEWWEWLRWSRLETKRGQESLDMRKKHKEGYEKRYEESEMEKNNDQAT